MISLALLFAASKTLHSGEGETEGAIERSFTMNIFTLAGKATTMARKHLNIENVAELAGTVVNSAQKSWAEGVAQANGAPRTPRAPRTGPTKMSTVIDAAKKKGMAARAAYQAGLNK